MFGFENINGHIRQLFHGTQQVLDQLVFSIKAEQSLLFKTYKLNERETAYFPQGSKSTGWRFQGKSKKVELANNIHKKKLKNALEENFITITTSSVDVGAVPVCSVVCVFSDTVMVEFVMLESFHLM